MSYSEALLQVYRSEFDNIEVDVSRLQNDATAISYVEQSTSNGDISVNRVV